MYVHRPDMQRPLRGGCRGTASSTLGSGAARRQPSSSQAAEKKVESN